jgi:hypothetical protein
MNRHERDQSFLFPIPGPGEKKNFVPVPAKKNFGSGPGPGPGPAGAGTGTTLPISTDKPKHGFSSISLVVNFSMKNFKRALPLFLVLVYIGHDKLKEKLFLLKISRVI